MRKLRKKTAALLKDRKGNMMPLVVAVTICMLIIILGVAEYMSLVITAAGIKDAMESAVISTVNDNYNEVYHSVREGYAAGYEPDGESFSASVDYGDIYSRMCFLLGLEEDGTASFCFLCPRYPAISTFTPTPIQIDAAFIKVVMGNDRETAVKAFSLSRATNALSIRL